MEQQMAQQQPVVAVVGRPNVGKSTLFNRILQQRRAIVQHTPGVTRDRIHADAEWLGRNFILVDTGGLVQGDELDPFTSAINRQVASALQEADVVIFVVDGREGLLPTDLELGRQLHRLGKPVLLAVNKIDHPQHRHLVQEFYRLGLGEPFAISAEHGVGTGDLLDAVLSRLPTPLTVGPDGTDADDDAQADDDTQTDDDAQDEGEDGSLPTDAPLSAGPVRVAVLGRPNVGKSSLVNALLGRDRFIVSPVAGTTRDAADVRWTSPDGDLIFVDTAGLRRRARVKEPVEFYSTLRAMAAMGRADVVLLVLDSQELITEQDKNIAAAIDERGRGAIIVVNKWDLLPATTMAEEVRAGIRAAMPFLAYAPIVLTSALTSRGLHTLPPLIREVSVRHRSIIPTPALNRSLSDALFDNQPRTVKGRRLKIRYATQSRRQPPTFLLFVNDPRLAEPAYLRYLERRLRASFDLRGTPIRLQLRPTP